MEYFLPDQFITLDFTQYNASHQARLVMTLEWGMVGIYIHSSIIRNRTFVWNCGLHVFESCFHLRGSFRLLI